MHIYGIHVHGRVIDAQTRCTHYHTKEDIIAMKSKCCQTYYPCYQCHNESVDHPLERWKRSEFDEKAILCGACGTELTIQDYMDNPSFCLSCKNHFNPNCTSHSHIYFEDEKCSKKTL